MTGKEKDLVFCYEELGKLVIKRMRIQLEEERLVRQIERLRGLRSQDE